MGISGQRRLSAAELRHRLDPWLIAAAALALIPALAMTRPGIPHTADGYVHLLRTLEVRELLQSRVLYPRWAPDFYFGYGYPFFNFYAGGAHWLAAVAAMGGLGVLGGVTALQITALFLYPVGAYLAARALYPAVSGTARPAALAAAAVYLYAPFRFRELFQQGNLSQLVALALLPWCAWLLARATIRADLRWSAAAGLALGALVYAHHPSAFLGYPFLAAYAVTVALIGAGRQGRWLGRRLAAALAPFGVGVLLSAPFWLPSLVELRDAGIAAIAAGMFNVRVNLLPLAELLAPARVLDDTALNPPQPNSLGNAQALLALAGLAAALAWLRAPGGKADSLSAEIPWTERQAGWTLLFVTGLLILALFLILPFAAPVWEALPLARFIAFPWRLLGPALLWAALLGGAALYLVPSRLRTPALLALLVLIPLSVATYLFPRPFAPVAEPTTADIARYELEGGARATASANEYLPRWVADPNPPTNMAEVIREGRLPDPLDRSTLPSGSAAVWTAHSPLSDDYQLDLPATAPVTLRRFFFPGWRAAIDGQLTPITASSPYGLIGVTVPAGRHSLEVSFGATSPRRVGAGLALAGCVATAALWWTGTRRRIISGRSTEDTAPGWRPALVALGTILVVTAAAALVIGPHTHLFRTRSPVEAPATMQHPVHARFANDVELIGYDLDDHAPQQGGTLAVRLYWRALTPQAANVRPFVHLDAVTGDETWANETKVHPGDKPSSRWTPGFYVVDDYRLLLPAETPPLAANVRTGLIDPSAKLVPLAAGGDTLTLAGVTIRERHPMRLETAPGHGQSYAIGDSIRLVGHAITTRKPSPESDATGPSLDVTLYWQAISRPPADYTVFAQVFDRSGQKIAQVDGPPVGGRYPSSAWTPGQIVVDSRAIALPKGVDPAGVQVAVGLYTPADGVRLPITDAQGARLSDDQVLLMLDPS